MAERTHTVTLLAGDGIGPEVTDAVLRILEARISLAIPGFSDPAVRNGHRCRNVVDDTVVEAQAKRDATDCS